MSGNNEAFKPYGKFRLHLPVGAVGQPKHHPDLESKGVREDKDSGRKLRGHRRFRPRPGLESPLQQFVRHGLF